MMQHELNTNLFSFGDRIEKEYESCVNNICDVATLYLRRAMVLPHCKHHSVSEIR